MKRFNNFLSETSNDRLTNEPVRAEKIRRSTTTEAEGTTLRTEFFQQNEKLLRLGIKPQLNCQRSYY